jgi:glycosyltransferase involved in cell wall biosynthesis
VCPLRIAGQSSGSRRPTIVCLADSPLLSTGFGTVAKEIYSGFHASGFRVLAYGSLDDEYYLDPSLPYEFFPGRTYTHDPLGHEGFAKLVNQVRPDVAWILTDLGNLHRAVDALRRELGVGAKGAVPLPIVAYFPVEGMPVLDVFRPVVDAVIESGGRLVTYCRSGAEELRRRFGNLGVQVVHHGADHAPFRRYTDDERRVLRHLAGFEDAFVVGIVGTNKRTKEFPLAVYIARELRDSGEGDGVKFYLHTEPMHRLMEGYPLVDLARTYGVEDMMLWKPDADTSVRRRFVGVTRYDSTLSRALSLRRPNSPAERATLFATFDFIARMNCLDMYLDVSSVEGWGLPPMEAMACGVPTATVDDRGVRSEVHSEGAYLMEPLPVRCWPTLHTGARLALLDPRTAAAAIARIRKNPELRAELSARGLATAARYKWDDSRDRMTRIVRSALSPEQQSADEPQ